VRVGQGRNRTASTTLKIAVLAPMPSAMIRIAVTAKAGLCHISEPSHHGLLGFRWGHAGVPQLFDAHGEVKRESSSTSRRGSPPKNRR
jgi:hypothetical protein